MLNMLERAAGCEHQFVKYAANTGKLVLARKLDHRPYISDLWNLIDIFCCVYMLNMLERAAGCEHQL